jgi:hypothetical protein
MIVVVSYLLLAFFRTKKLHRRKRRRKEIKGQAIKPDGYLAKREIKMCYRDVFTAH